MSGDKLKALTELVFIREIVIQAKIADRAASYVEPTADDMDPNEIWGEIQSILIAAAKVSKILWPPRTSSASRGEMLRKLLRVDVRSPLSDRSIRNTFEHYDKRIEDWFEDKGSAVYIDFKIDSFDSVWGGQL